MRAAASPKTHVQLTDGQGGVAERTGRCIKSGSCLVFSKLKSNGIWQEGPLTLFRRQDSRTGLCPMLTFTPIFTLISVTLSQALP